MVLISINHLLIIKNTIYCYFNYIWSIDKINKKMDFNKLINNIQITHNVLQASVSKAINTGTTVRNWLFGFYIVEFEQNGEDRAKYGDNLLSNISKSAEIKGLSVTNLKLFRQFYRIYPEIGQALTDFFDKNNIIDIASEQLSIHQSATDESVIRIRQSATDELQNAIKKLVSKENNKKFGSKPSKLLSTLSFTHLVELIKIEDSYKIAF